MHCVPLSLPFALAWAAFLWAWGGKWVGYFKKTKNLF